MNSFFWQLDIISHSHPLNAFPWYNFTFTRSAGRVEEASIDGYYTLLFLARFQHRGSQVLLASPLSLGLQNRHSSEGIVYHRKMHQHITSCVICFLYYMDLVPGSGNRKTYVFVKSMRQNFGMGYISVSYILALTDLAMGSMFRAMMFRIRL